MADAVENDTPKTRTVLRTWILVTAVIASTGAAGTVLAKAIAWPFEDKTEAKQEHDRLEKKIDTVQSETRDEIRLLRQQFDSLPKAVADELRNK